MADAVMIFVRSAARRVVSCARSAAVRSFGGLVVVGRGGARGEGKEEEGKYGREGGEEDRKKRIRVSSGEGEGTRLEGGKRGEGGGELGKAGRRSEVLGGLRFSKMGKEFSGYKLWCLVFACDTLMWRQTPGIRLYRLPDDG